MSQNKTFFVEVDEWPKQRRSGQTRYKVYWEANAVNAVPDKIVRIPNEYFVGVKFDGTKYTVEVKFDTEYMAATRQPYLRQSAGLQ